MRWASESDCKRISSLWALAYGSSNRNESANAFAALKRQQADLALSDTELAFIGESRINSDGTSDRPLDVLLLILRLFDENHIIFSSFERVIHRRAVGIAQPCLRPVSAYAASTLAEP